MHWMTFVQKNWIETSFLIRLVLHKFYTVDGYNHFNSKISVASQFFFQFKSYLEHLSRIYFCLLRETDGLTNVFVIGIQPCVLEDFCIKIARTPIHITLTIDIECFDCTILKSQTL